MGAIHASQVVNAHDLFKNTQVIYLVEIPPHSEIGVIDQSIDPPEFFKGKLHRLFTKGLVFDVQWDRDALLPRR